MSSTVDYLRSLNLQIIDVFGLPFSYRGETSDEVVGNEILEEGKYVLPIEDFQPKVIIDCGSNIGYSTLYFANTYPDAQIYAIEPEKINFKFLRYNTIFYDNIQLINSAVWGKETSVRLEETELGERGYMTDETSDDDPNGIKTTTLGNLIYDNGINEIDLLKIDVVGAEKEIFGAEGVDDWLSKVKVLSLVIHDELKSGASFEVFKAISKYKWNFSTRNNVLTFIRNFE
ncbi:MAG: FkbM family methyltransferase [Selenomonadaceae bacterium]|nr:FkbM family methyltransferase [Selenomonadaceae bacterium]